MSCYSTVTGTHLSTLTSKSVSTSYSASVSSLAGTKVTVTSCEATATFGFPIRTCTTYETTIGGGASTVRVPVPATVTFTQDVTSTLYGTTCSSGSLAASSDSSSGPPTSSTMDSGTSLSDSQTSADSSSQASTTIMLQSTETTVIGGSTVTTAVSSLEVVAVTAVTTVAVSVQTGRSASGSGSSNSTPDGAIIGAIVGGIAALVILAFGFAFFLREKKRPDDGEEKETQPDTPVMSRILRKRRDNKDVIDIDTVARPFTPGLPYREGDLSTTTIPPLPPQKESPPMHFVARLKPLPRSPRATWYSTRTIPAKPTQQPDRSSVATIRPPGAAPPQLPQLTINPPTPPGQHAPLLHAANISPRNSAMLTPPPLPEKGSFMPRPRRGKAPEQQDHGAPPRASLRASFLSAASLRMPVPQMPAAIRSVVQHTDAGPARAGPSSVRRDKAAEAASEARAQGSGEMPPPAYSE